MSNSKLVVGCVSLSLFLTSYIGNALTVAVPFFVEHYQTLPQYASFALTGYATALACFLLPASLLAKRFSNRTIFLLGLSSCAVITALIPLSPTLLILVLGRILQGAAASMCLATGMALISNHVPTSKRYIAIGIAVCLTYTGVSSSLSFSGVIIDNYGYQYMFYAASSAMGLLLTLALCIPKDDQAINFKDQPLPYGKLVLFVLSIGLCLLSLSALASFSYARYGLASGLALLAVLVIYEYQNSKKDNYQELSTVIPVQFLVNNRRFTYCFLVSFAAYVSVMAEPVLLALFSQYTLGISATAAGFIIVVQPITIAVVSYFTGRITKLLGGNATVTLGLIIQTIALATFVVIDTNTTVLSLVLRQLAVGTGFALFSAPNTTLITLSVAPKDYALASSMQQLGRSLGQGTAYALVTVTIAALVSAAPGSIAYPEQFAQASVVILAISAALGLLGIVFSALGYLESRKAENDSPLNESSTLAA